MTATFHPHHPTAARRTRGPRAELRRPAADRGQSVALAVLALGAIAVVVTVGALVDLGGRPAAASEIPAPGSERRAAPSLHVAAPGDTLWSIAEQYRGEVEP